MEKWIINCFYAPDGDSSGSSDSGGAGDGAAGEGSEGSGQGAASGGQGQGAAAGSGAAAATQTPARIKIGNEELTVEALTAELTSHRANKATLDALSPIARALQSNDRNAALQAIEGMFPKPLDPNDIKGRLDQQEAFLRQQAEMQQAMLTLGQLQQAHGEEFKGDMLMRQLADLRVPFDPQNFGKHIELAHKAGQYDVLKADFDTKLKAGIEAGVREALKKGAQLNDAGNVQGAGGAAGNKNDSWEGDPVEVAKRKGLKIGG